MLLRSRFAAGLAPVVLAVAGCRAPDPTDHVRVGSNGDADLPCDHTLTDFPGDCVAPAPVDPSVGVVAKYGPRDYDDPTEIAKYVIQPGQEMTNCGYSRLSNDSELVYNRYDVMSRPGMHHVILDSTDADVPDGTVDDCTMRDQNERLLAVLQGGIEGSVYHYPPSGKLAPENAVLGTRLSPHQMIAYELHAINTTDHPLLRENWTIFYAADPAVVTGTVGQLAFNGGLEMHVPPHTSQIIKNSCTVPDWIASEVRVVDFFGHMHAHGKRFSAWAVTRSPGDGGVENRTLIYESYDWSKLDLIQFDSVDQNTPIRYAGGVPGGYSGILMLEPGDRIDYECEIDNTTDRPLTFAAKAYTGEMCNLFGSFAPGAGAAWTCLGN
jgi:hypothetical protein